MELLPIQTFCFLTDVFGGSLQTMPLRESQKTEMLCSSPIIYSLYSL